MFTSLYLARSAKVARRAIYLCIFSGWPCISDYLLRVKLLLLLWLNIKYQMWTAVRATQYDGEVAVVVTDTRTRRRCIKLKCIKWNSSWQRLLRLFVSVLAVWLSSFPLLFVQDFSNHLIVVMGSAENVGLDSTAQTLTCIVSCNMVLHFPVLQFPS